MTHEYKACNINTLYTMLCYALSSAPEILVRGKKTKELMNVACVLDDHPCNSIITHPGRNIDLRYLIGEFCFYLRGSDKLHEINKYSKFWNTVSDDGATVNSAYGKRIFMDLPQLDYCVSVLARDPFSRKAVIPIYRAYDNTESKDNPCTMFLQFYIRDQRLHMVTHMRSNDIWFGFTYDVPFFRLLQEMVCVKLGEKPGVYIHQVTSLHVYEKDFAAVEAIGTMLPANRQCDRPTLEYLDVGAHFAYLLEWEKALREKGKCLELFSSTAFQEWAMKKLTGD